MQEITITEALAEVKTLGKRIQKKREFVEIYLARQEALKDPLEKQGGSWSAIVAERQAISDLSQRIIDIRRAIHQANVDTEVKVNGSTRSIADWLVWRRDVMPEYRDFLSRIRMKVTQVRDEAQKKGLNVFQGEGAQSPTDVIINLDEAALAGELEKLEETLGILDGQLSLKNALVAVSI